MHTCIHPPPYYSVPSEFRELSCSIRHFKPFRYVMPELDNRCRRGSRKKTFAPPPKFSLPSPFPTLFPSPPYPLNFSSHPFPPSPPFPFPLPPLSFFLIPSFPSISSFPSPPFHPLRSRPTVIQQLLRGLGECCKLPQRGLGQSPSRNRIWCILALKSDI